MERMAASLGRALSLEDLDGVLLAYSSNQPTTDRVRVNFLLSKKVPADVSSWQLSHGIASAVRPVIVPANEELGMLGRVCVPLLARGYRVGYLWVLQDAEEDAAAILPALKKIRREQDELAEMLLDTNTAESEHRRRREAQFLLACSGNEQATEAVAGWSEVRGRGPWQTATVLRVPDPAERHTRPRDPEERVLLQRISALQATVGIQAALFSAGTETHAVILFSGSPGRAASAEVLDRYRHEIARRSGRPPREDVLGMSEPFTDLRQLPAAYRQSRHAAQAAAADAPLGPVADYRAIGIYQFLGGASRELAPVESVHFGELKDQDRAGELLPLLELLYDSDGSIQEVAKELHLHRSSLYNRLARIRAVVGSDPLKGRLRLELHAALKANRWAGRPRLEDGGA